jgi:hypothetical protein
VAKAPASKKNWSKVGDAWLSIADYGAPKGPALLADETRTIMWFSEKPSADAVLHKHHARDESGHFRFAEGGDPEIEERDVVPVYWSPAIVID